ncbi:hypothetical protein B6U99_07115 [Candidatus Geothermarchaeota archaeon ex4572_27]|nr:MAG: hypothetical protein B6U99_07115 [Candidatus Geothermarchaeota archaeon ex4572_27]
MMPEILKRLDEDYEGAIRGLIAPLAFSSRADPRLVEASIAEMLRVPRHVAIRNFRACDGFDVRHRLGEVRAPTLIIAGSEDRLTPIKWAEELHRGVAGSTLRVIDGCGHVSMLERPREFNEALVEFTSRLKP